MKSYSVIYFLSTYLPHKIHYEFINITETGLVDNWVDVILDIKHYYVNDI